MTISGLLPPPRCQVTQAWPPSCSRGESMRLSTRNTGLLQVKSCSKPSSPTCGKRYVGYGQAVGEKKSRSVCEQECLWAVVFTLLGVLPWLVPWGRINEEGSREGKGTEEPLQGCAMLRLFLCGCWGKELGGKSTEIGWLLTETHLLLPTEGKPC